MRMDGQRRVQVLRIMCLTLAMFGWLSADASAQWYSDGVQWMYHPGSGYAMPGKCLGNCGIDCSTKREPWGGCGRPDRGYWTLDLIWGPNHIMTLGPGDASEEFQPIGQYDEYYNGCWGYDFEYLYDVYDGAGTWTYHGLYSRFCSDHDHACRKGGFFANVYCYFPMDTARACSGAHYQTWSYDTYMIGEKNGYRNVLGWRYGPC
jgi:hypothetical protein